MEHRSLLAAVALDEQPSVVLMSLGDKIAGFVSDDADEDPHRVVTFRVVHAHRSSYPIQESGLRS